jgi:hypothetical protein
MPIDYKRYPPNWKTEIVPAVLARANNCCEFEGCKFKNGQMVYRGKLHNRIEWFETLSAAYDLCGEFMVWEKPIKVVLTIAHLDHDETNHDVKLDRLAAMCQLHHLRYDAKEKYRRGKVNWIKKSKLQNLFDDPNH